MSAMSGVMDQMKERMGDAFDKVMSYPDKAETKQGRFACRILFDLGLILAGTLVMGSLSGFSLSSLGSGGFQGLSRLVFLAPIAIGTAWLIQDLTPKKFHKPLAVISAIALPVLLVTAGVLISKGALQNGPTYAFTQPHLLLGLAMMPLGLGSIGMVSYPVFKSKEKRMEFKAHQPAPSKGKHVEMTEFKRI